MWEKPLKLDDEGNLVLPEDAVIKIGDAEIYLDGQDLILAPKGNVGVGNTSTNSSDIIAFRTKSGRYCNIITYYSSSSKQGAKYSGYNSSSSVAILPDKGINLEIQSNTRQLMIRHEYSSDTITFDTPNKALKFLKPIYNTKTKYTGNITEQAGGSTYIGTYTLRYVPVYDEDGEIVGGSGTLVLDLTTTPTAGTRALYLTSSKQLPKFTFIVGSAQEVAYGYCNGVDSGGFTAITTKDALTQATTYEGSCNIFKN